MRMKTARLCCENGKDTVSIALSACFLRVSPIQRHKPLPMWDHTIFINQAAGGRRSRTIL